MYTFFDTLGIYVMIQGKKSTKLWGLSATLVNTYKLTDNFTGKFYLPLITDRLAGNLPVYYQEFTGKIYRELSGHRYFPDNFPLIKSGK